MKFPIYLDNNATTTMPPCVMKAMLRWCNMGNASASYASAKRSRAMMDSFRAYIGELCGVNTCCPEERDADSNIHASKCDPNKYKVIFTSGASEANSTILGGVVAAYAHARKVTPHIVMAATEHKGLISMAHSLEERGLAVVTFVQPIITGTITPESIAEAIRPTTCIVCVMHANNETGAINDVEAIGKVAHSRGVPFHCDTVQTFGKFPVNPLTANIDSFCVSFHKFRGPPGSGVLVVKQQLLIGYNLQPTIFGSQNEGYRGGTENLPGIGASYEALKYNFEDRDTKNRKMMTLKTLLLCELSKKFRMRTYADYYEASNDIVSTGGRSVQMPRLELVVFSTPSADSYVASTFSDPDYIAASEEMYLCNTVLLSVIKRTGDFICNSKMKNHLEAAGIVVSVGSACNTASPKASHVLYAMDADKYIRKGTLRISIGDDNTAEDILKFVKCFCEAVTAQL